MTTAAANRRKNAIASEALPDLPEIDAPTNDYQCTDGCEKCGLFRCAICKELVPWSRGSDDDMPDACDDCWAAKHAGGARP